MGEEPTTAAVQLHDRADEPDAADERRERNGVDHRERSKLWMDGNIERGMALDHERRVRHRQRVNQLQRRAQRRRRHKRIADGNADRRRSDVHRHRAGNVSSDFRVQIVLNSEL